MSNPIKILVTGGYGFVGSNLVRYLNSKGVVPHVYDTAYATELWRNVVGLEFNLVSHAGFSYAGYDAVVHLGANVKTTETMNDGLWRNNFELTRNIIGEVGGFKNSLNRITRPKLIYASSAAVYGAEETDFSERCEGLKPLNAYAYTKLMVDKCAEGRISSLDLNPTAAQLIGLRFFNVYGPNERHKGDMASVVHKALHKMSPVHTGRHEWNLFKSYRDGIAHGEQRRDFVYVGDVCDVIWHFIENDCESGVYNLGSGTARTFNDLVRAVDPKPSIEYVDMPIGLRDQYQYHTQANLNKLRTVAKYTKEFTTLEAGIEKTREAMS